MRINGAMEILQEPRLPSDFSVKATPLAWDEQGDTQRFLDCESAGLKAAATLQTSSPSFFSSLQPFYSISVGEQLRVT